MSHLRKFLEQSAKIESFITRDILSGNIIEPKIRVDLVSTTLIEHIKFSSPKVIIKMGIGRGEILRNMAKATKGIIIVIEPSIDSLIRYKDKFGQGEEFTRIRLVCGNFNLMPLEYYRADMLVNIDYFDFIDIGIVVDEMAGVVNFGGHLFLGTAILNEKDDEGGYDEFLRSIFPIHNDIYMKQELETIMRLKSFDMISDSEEIFSIDLNEKISEFSNFYDINSKIDDEYKKILQDYYGFDGKSIKEEYIVAIFKRAMEHEEEYEI